MPALKYKVLLTSSMLHLVEELDLFSWKTWCVRELRKTYFHVSIQYLWVAIIPTMLGFAVNQVITDVVAFVLKHFRSYYYIASFERNCTEDSLRLFGGASSLEGRVELCVNGDWSIALTSSGWDYHDASVVCRQLNHSSLGARLFFPLLFYNNNYPYIRCCQYVYCI